MKILLALEKYEKIRLPLWNDNLHIYKKNGSLYFGTTDDDSNIYSLTDIEIQSDNWEEYIKHRKYLTHKEAMQALIDGHKISMKIWGEDLFISLDSDGYIVNKYGKRDGVSFCDVTNTDNYDFYIVE